LPGKAVADFLAMHLPPGATLCLGLSGGRDSVVLLHLLKSLIPERLRAIHVHHGLSPNADDWADFCAQLCREWDIPLEIARVAVHREGRGLEAAARAARYQAFKADGLSHLALAHHCRDQAETMLLNLCRGAGVSGAAAMRGLRQIEGMSVLRPLLGVGEEEIAAYARAHKLSWVEDESNAETHFRRNFLRLEVLPRLSSSFPAAEANLARAASHFAEAQSLLHELAAEDDAHIAANGQFFTLLSTARQANWLRWYLHTADWSIPDTARLMDGLRQFTDALKNEGYGELPLSEGKICLWKRRFYRVTHVVIPERPSVWDGKEPVFWAGGWLRLEEKQGEGIARERLCDGVQLTLRPRTGGETLRLGWNRPRRLLKKLLQEADVPPWQREHLPLLYIGDELVACPGIGIAAEWQAKETGWFPIYGNQEDDKSPAAFTL